MKTNKLLRASLIALLLSGHVVYGQTTVISESMGSVTTTTAISAYETANGFDNDPQTMTGTADIRNTSPSSGYTGASGLANVFVTNTVGKFFQIEDINTTGMSALTLSFGISKSTNASNGSDFIVEVSADGTTYSALTYSPLPTGSGTAVWRKVTASGTIPATSNLRIRFRQNGTATQYRIDDVLLTGTACEVSIVAEGPTTVCEGNGVILTASPAGGTYLWSTGETTQSIFADSATSYSASITAGGCTATSNSISITVVEPIGVIATASADTVCKGDTITLSARLQATGLIFSEYVEGSGNEKYVEIFNGTGTAVNLANYHYQAFHNGIGIATPTFDFALSGTLADGDVIVLKNPSATLYTGAATAYTGIQHNGDDAIALLDTVNNVYVDIFGSIGNDPGSQWNSGTISTLDHTLRRNDLVVSGVSTNPNLPGITGFPTLGTEWTQYAQDDVTGLGSHSLNCDFLWSNDETGCSIQVAAESSATYTATYQGICSVDANVNVVVIDCESRMAKSGKINSSTDAMVFPNPFQGATTIQFHVANSSEVSVEILDMNGQVVANLLKGQMEAGVHRVEWNVEGKVPAGVYVCRIATGSEIQTLHIVLQ